LAGAGPKILLNRNNEDDCSIETKKQAGQGAWIGTIGLAGSLIFGKCLHQI
jgi:hypothetical protein